MAEITTQRYHEVMLNYLEGKVIMFDTEYSQPSLEEEVIETLSGNVILRNAIKTLPLSGQLEDLIPEFTQNGYGMDLGHVMLKGKLRYGTGDSDYYNLSKLSLFTTYTVSSEFVAHLISFGSTKYEFNTHSSAPATQDKTIPITIVKPDGKVAANYTLSLEDVTLSDGSTSTAADFGFSINSGSPVAHGDADFQKTQSNFTLQFTKAATNVTLGGHTLKLKVDNGTDHQFIYIPVLVESYSV